MNLTVNREALLLVCRLAARLLPERPVRPAETHLLLRADAGSAGSLHAAGAEASLRLSLAVQVARSGEALLPARAALAVLRASSATDVTVEVGEGVLVLRWPGARCRLESPPAACLADDEDIPAGPSRQLPAGDLCRALRSVLFASGIGRRRYRFDGVLFECETACLRLVATDNRRLAVAELPTPAPPGAPVGPCVLPVVAADLLARLAEGADAVEMRLGDGGQTSFIVGGAVLACRGDAGPFPPWRSAVPAGPPHILAVPVAGLLDAVRQAAVLREQAGAKLLLTLEPGRLVLESARAGAGSVRVSRKVDFGGGPVRVALEPRYVEEMLRCLEGEPAVEIGLTDKDTPARFRSGGYLHVLMPLAAG